MTLKLFRFKAGSQLSLAPHKCFVWLMAEKKKVMMGTLWRESKASLCKRQRTRIRHLMTISSSLDKLSISVRCRKTLRCPPRAMHIQPHE